MEDINKLIEQYYELSNYGSVDKVYKLLQIDEISIPKKSIKEYLNKKEETQLLNEDKQSKLKYTPIVAMDPNDIWCIDIFVLAKYKKTNKNYSYIFAVIDVFTRKTYCIAMKTKDIDDVTNALNTIMKKNSVTPKVIVSDSDSSFTGFEFQKLLKQHEIIHNTVIINDHHSLGIIDRFARTLKTIFSKLFIKNKNTDWISHLDSVINRYNNNPHSSIADMKPNEAHIGEYYNIIKDINIAKSKIEGYKNDFKEGDKVRIRIEGIFKKGTEPRFSDEIYIVKSVRGSTVTLNNDKAYRVTSLLKINKDFVIPEKIKRNVIKQATKDKKQEQLHKRIDVQESNILEGKRERKKKVY